MKSRLAINTEHVLCHLTEQLTHRKGWAKNLMLQCRWCRSVFSTVSTPPTEIPNRVFDDLAAIRRWTAADVVSLASVSQVQRKLCPGRSEL